MPLTIITTLAPTIERGCVPYSPALEALQGLCFLTKDKNRVRQTLINVLIVYEGKDSDARFDIHMVTVDTSTGDYKSSVEHDCNPYVLLRGLEYEQITSEQYSEIMSEF